jgi:hypothetical protein
MTFFMDCQMPEMDGLKRPDYPGERKGGGWQGQ